MKEINKQMLKTMGARIRLIRKSRKESQSDFAKHFDLKQGAISQWEIGESELEERHITTLIDKLKVNEKFIRFGTGEPFSELRVVEEPQAHYFTKIIFSPEQIITRFEQTVNAYSIYNNKTMKDVAELLQINYTYLVNIVNGRNTPTVEIIYKAAKRIGINPNYIILGHEPKFLKQ